MFNFNGRLSKESLIGLFQIAPSYGVIQFVLLTLLAVIFYPGGFDFYSQHFSELGAKIARNGELNIVSSSLFVVALITIAMTLIPFWFEITSILRDTRGIKAAIKLGSTLGLMSSPFIIGVALSPIDTQPEMHYHMFLVFFPLFNLASVVYSIAIILDQRINVKYGILGLLLFTLSIMVIINPLASYVAFLQKVLLYGYFSWVFILNKVVSRRSIEGEKMENAVEIDR